MSEESARLAVAVGIDLGGTSLVAAVIDAEGRRLAQAKRKTKPELGASGIVARIADTARKAIARAELEPSALVGLGVGVPGPVDPDTGLVSRCPNLGPTWDHFPLAEALSRAIDLPVTLENDVNAGAVGEFTYGAGRGTRDMLAIFVGTGLGGGLILDGRLRQGARHSAAEVGHMVVLAGGPVCGCGQKGCAEALASRTAIERDIREAIAAGRHSVVSALLEESGRDVIASGIIGRAVEAGDAVTLEVLARAQFYLGILISACVNLVDPEAVVVGGGVVERLGDAYLEPVRRTARQHYINKDDADRVRIVPAALGDYSGATGAAVLALDRLR